MTLVRERFTYDAISKEEDKALFTEMIDDQTSIERKLEITTRLYEKHSPFATYVIKKEFPYYVLACRKFRMTVDEYFSDGRFALYKAITSYKINAGGSFLSYAETCIKNEMIDLHRRMTLRSNVYSLDKSEDQYAQFRDEFVSLSEVHERISLNQRDEYQDVLIRMTFDKIMDTISKSLSDEELDIIRMHLEQGMSQIDIVNAMGSNKARVNRKIKKGLSLIKRTYALSNTV